MKHALYIFSSIALVGLASACGGSSTPAAAPPKAASAEPGHGERAGHGEQAHHENLAPALKDFHGVLAPVWHSEPGPTRVEKACTNSKSLQEKAKATGDAELIAATSALDPACAKDGRADVETKVGTVHERFHKLAEPAKH